MERSVARLFERWARVVTRHPWSVLAAAIAVVGFFAAQTPKIIVETTTEGFLHADDPALVAYNDFRQRFGRDDGILVAVESDEIFSVGFLERLRDFHEDLERSTPFVSEITSMLNARWTRGDDDQLLVEDLITEMPSDEAGVAELRRRVYANPLYLDNLINRDGQITTILIDPETFVQTGIDENGRPIQRYLSGAENRQLSESIRAVAEHHSADGFEIHIVGMLRMADRLAFRMLEDLPRLVRRGLIVIAIVLFALFGNIRSVALPLLVVVSAGLVTAGSMPLLDIPYQLPTQVAALTLLAIGIGDSIHVIAMFYHFRRTGREKPDALADAFAHAGPALLITSLTTAGALLSFLSAELAPIANLGILLPIGVTAAFFATLTILPALIVVLPGPKNMPRQRSFAFMEQGLRRTGVWAADHAPLVFGATAIVVLVALAGASRVQFSHNPLLWFPEDNPLRKSTLMLNERLGGVVTLEVLFESGKAGGVKDPELLGRIDQLTALNNEYVDNEVEQMRIGKTISIVDLLKETNRALNGNRDSSYELPTSRELVAQELLLFELSGNNDLEDLADYEYQTARMSLRVPWMDATHYGGATDELIDLYRDRVGDLADVELTGRVPLLTRTMNAVVQSMAASYIIAFAAVTPMMMLFLGSARLGMLAMIPNLLPVVAALGLMGFLGLPLDVFSLLTGSITLGVAVDDTIHFMHGVRRELGRGADTRGAIEQTLTVTGQALFSTTLILCCGFGLYTTAYMQNLANFGFVTAFALAVALAADIIVAPALVSLLGANRVARQTP